LALCAAPAVAHQPRGIVVGRDGTVFFSTLVKIRAVSPKGKLRTVRENAQGHTHALALAADGAIWGDQSAYDSADGSYHEAIWRMLPDGSLTFRYGPRKGTERGIGLLRDRHGCAWHADQAAPGGAMLVHRKCLGRPVERMFGSARDDSAYKPVLVADLGGTALASDGSFIFRDRGTIRRIAPDGKATVLARGLAAENFGIALEPDGAVLVAEHSKRRVVAVSPGRRTQVVATSPAPWGPTGLTWDKGALYLLEASDHRPGTPDQMRVRRIGADGTDKVLATAPLSPG